MKHILRPLSLLVLLGLLSACGGSSAPADGAPAPQASPTTPAGPQARVVDVINQVEAHPTAEADWAPAVVDAVIYLGGEVHAHEASTARLRIEETLVRVAPNTIFSFRKPSTDTLQIDLQNGQIWLNVEGLQPGQQFEVRTPAAVASVRGTRFSVRIDPAGITHVSVMQGAVDLTGAGTTVTVPEGHQSSVKPGEAPLAPAPFGLLETLRWGMAYGPGLDVILPIYGEPVMVQEAGEIISGGPPVFSPDGRWLFYHIFDPVNSTESFNTLWDLNTGMTAPIKLPAKTFTFVFNPRDGRIAYADSSRICVSQMDGTDLSCSRNDSFRYSNVRWSPDGTSLLAIGNNNTLFTGQPGGSLSPLPVASSRYKYEAIWSLSGKKVAWLQSESSKNVSLWTANADGTGAAELLRDLPYNVYMYPYSWLPDDALFAATRDGIQWFSPNLTGARPLTPPAPGTYNGLAASPSPTGFPLFYRFAPADAPQAFLRYMITGLEETPIPLPDWTYGPFWSAQGDYMLIGTVQPPSRTSSAITTFYRFPANSTFLLGLKYQLGP